MPATDSSRSLPAIDPAACRTQLARSRVQPLLRSQQRPLAAHAQTSTANPPPRPAPLPPPAPRAARPPPLVAQRRIPEPLRAARQVRPIAPVPQPDGGLGVVLGSAPRNLIAPGHGASWQQEYRDLVGRRLRQLFEDCDRLGCVLSGVQRQVGDILFAESSSRETAQIDAGFGQSPG